ncbi:hypothetical protein LYNGBM3L_16890 [Moorena producens 3L]|uniref:Uncharacterized protein n=1 Tax=Moorena producens 3L TaxID=489825 RepID=F4XSD1_9CYAN|nr:hypothetical protein LYNGBM3L_16890 [Moorena producens 3L]
MISASKVAALASKVSSTNTSIVPKPRKKLPNNLIPLPCVDAVAHGGNPQDRAASLEEVYATILYYLHNKEEVRAYLADWLEFCRQQREQQKRNPSPARQRFRQLKAEADAQQESTKSVKAVT